MASSDLPLRTLRVGRGETEYGAAVDALERLKRACLPGTVILPTRVLLDPQGDVVVLEDVQGEMTLERALDLRGGLDASECVWWAVPIASALASLHRAGLSHGEVNARNVTFTPDGVVLTGVINAATLGRGWPAAGHEGADPVTLPAAHVGNAAADVAALGALLELSVRETDSERIGAWVAPMTAPEAIARPSAAMVARALVQCAQAQPVRVPAQGVAHAMRAAARDERGVGATALGASGGRVRDAMRAVGAKVRPGVLVAVSALVVLAGLGATMLGAFGHSRAPHDHQPAAAPSHGIEDPQDAAGRLTRDRYDALMRADAHALVALTAPASPARAAAVVQGHEMNTGALEFSGLELTSVAAQEWEDREPKRGDWVQVLVTTEVAPYDVIVGGSASHVPGATSTVVLTLALGESGHWEVVSAQAVSLADEGSSG